MSGGKELVLSTLRQAVSQNAEELKPAEQQLQLWEEEPGFYSTLVEIFSEHSIEFNVRWLAVLYFKNGIDCHWRKGAPRGISEEEKARIRCGLLHNLQEPVPQIALQLAVLIGKLARYDVPKDWPELLPSLFEGVKSNDALVEHRTLLTLHHVVKQLASKRLVAGRRLFQELTSEMLEYLLELWMSQTEAFLGASCCDRGSIFVASLERFHLSLKILRKLVTYGVKKPNENQKVVSFVHGVFDKIRVMLSFRKQYEHSEIIRGISEKYLVLLTKVLLDLLENFPFSYLEFILPSLELTVYYIFTPAGEGLLFNRFIVQCFNLIRSLLLCPEYKPCKVITETKNPETLKAYEIKCKFFTKEVLSGILNKLLSQYFLMTEDDLKLWDSDPEEFCSETEGGGESWKYSLRPCTETLFVSFFHEYRTILTTLLMEIVQSVGSADAIDLTNILKKDAVYNAVGLAAFELFDEIDFDQWFTSTLVEELKVKDSNYRIIRRRVIWLVGQWSSVRFSSENRPLLYQACMHLLSAEEDFVVRVSAALTLKSAIDDFEFQPEQFAPFLPSAFELLFSLLKEARECDTKMQVLHVMSFMIEMVGTDIQPHAAPLAQYLPLLWEESADHNMLRCAILTTLIHMVSGLMRESENLHGFLLPIIKLSTDVNEPSHVYLMEDGLQLWLTTLENCHMASETILDLYSNIIPLLEYSSESLRLCLQITNVYILLCPQQFLVKYGEALIKTFQSIMTELKNEGIVLIMKCLEMMLRVCPDQAALMLCPVLPAIVHNSVAENVLPMTLSMYFSLLARLLLYAEDIFAWAVTKAAEDAGSCKEDYFESFVSHWALKMPIVSPEERQKLCALGLALLCGKGWPSVMNVWHLVFSAVAEVVFDLTLEESDEDKLVVNGARPSSPEFYDRETEHLQRTQAIARQDPVHTIALRFFLAQQLKSLGQLCDTDVMSKITEKLEENSRSLLEEILA